MRGGVLYVREVSFFVLFFFLNSVASVLIDSGEHAECIGRLQVCSSLFPCKGHRAAETGTYQLLPLSKEVVRHPLQSEEEDITHIMHWSQVLQEDVFEKMARMLTSDVPVKLMVSTALGRHFVALRDLKEGTQSV
jgi:hypothetical protein